MMKQETFKGWDFDNVWSIEESNSYPTLKAEVNKIDYELDTDGDGLKDYEEVYIYGTDPKNADTDGDGLNDYIEIYLRTDPLKADTDGDGLTDYEEIYIY